MFVMPGARAPSWPRDLGGSAARHAAARDEGLPARHRLIRLRDRPSLAHAGPGKT